MQAETVVHAKTGKCVRAIRAYRVVNLFEADSNAGAHVLKMLRESIFGAWGTLHGGNQDKRVPVQLTKVIMEDYGKTALGFIADVEYINKSDGIKI